ncbi:protein Exd1 homolog isoform X2 [Drosophila grimshawi]|uniref:GH17078 n=2 Tax=Drosophila grimshawi TaxID=7222 RepID=B4J026_DROGR|nr:protein Exd1 homolog isoform X2 [Drosophila grimshawi]XP_032594645.1 protein Exd1 homolog isoform X2 [Drosophila grimshawi]EDV97819.1 GH17078 [Drosophila grimshawi]
MNGHCFEDDNESEKSFASAPEWETKPIRSCPLQPHVLLSLDQKLKRIIFIQQTDQSYHKALSDICDQMIISVLIEPFFYGRHCNASVIVIATANNTYVFDLKAMGAIFSELSKLLEAECPRKIMHYSHRICDLLLHQHKLRINGISDTFVAWCVARQDRSHCTLQEAISLTFDLHPSELTCDEIKSVTESVRNFTARPLSRGQLQYLGKIAILQHKLHDTLIYENICRDLQLMSGKFSCEFNKQSNSDEVAMEMGPTSKAGFDCIDASYKITSTIN